MDERKVFLALYRYAVSRSIRFPFTRLPPRMSWLNYLVDCYLAAAFVLTVGSAVYLLRLFLAKP